MALGRQPAKPDTANAESCDRVGWISAWTSEKGSSESIYPSEIPEISDGAGRPTHPRSCISKANAMVPAENRIYYGLLGYRIIG